MEDSNDRRRPYVRPTHFDQVPLEVVKRIARPDDEEAAAREEGTVEKIEPYSVPPDRLKKTRR